MLHQIFRFFWYISRSTLLEISWEVRTVCIAHQQCHCEIGAKPAKEMHLDPPLLIIIKTNHLGYHGAPTMEVLHVSFDAEEARRVSGELVNVRIWRLPR